MFQKFAFKFVVTFGQSGLEWTFHCLPLLLRERDPVLLNFHHKIPGTLATDGSSVSLPCHWRIAAFLAARITTCKMSRPVRLP